MSKPSNVGVEILDDPEALACRAADWLLAQSRAADGLFSVVLSGGSTPRRLYELMAARPFRDAFPWTRTHWFWGDERFVPRHDPASNFRMVDEALLARVPIPGANIHPIRTEGTTPEAAAAQYERELKSFYGAPALKAQQPLFDVVLLGLGLDGHTASLFPQTAVLEERSRWVAAVLGAKPEPRITLTFPALESSREAVFLVTGDGKRSVLERVLRGDRTLPAARLHPLGSLRFLVDRAAAPKEPQ